MTPYYQQDDITIYHADCADVLPSIDPTDVDLLLTDPPYGIDYVGSDIHDTRTIQGDSEPFDPTPLLRFNRLVLFGANNYADKLPASPGWIVWDKRLQSSESVSWPDGDLAWTNFVKSIRIYRHLWAGPIRTGERPTFIHPTQKPVGLMRWILEQWTQPGDLVLDPYMGSGPIAQACFELGRRYIGVEIEEQYCAITVERRFNQMSLFA